MKKYTRIQSKLRLGSINNIRHPYPTIALLLDWRHKILHRVYMTVMKQHRSVIATCPLSPPVGHVHI